MGSDSLKIFAALDSNSTLHSQVRVFLKVISVISNHKDFLVPANRNELKLFELCSHCSQTCHFKDILNMLLILCLCDGRW